MQDLVSEAENDSKSSAGDKHETGRAMMQLAQEQLSKQLQDAELKRNTLNRIDACSQHTVISEGSLVYTDEAIYFISAPIGKIQFEGMEVFVISSQSPLGKVLIGKNAGESLTLNNRTIYISRLS
jgi:transcription elongation GreA/GreB family factor